MLNDEKRLTLSKGMGKEDYSGNPMVMLLEGCNLWCVIGESYISVGNWHLDIVGIYISSILWNVLHLTLLQACVVFEVNYCETDGVAIHNDVFLLHSVSMELRKEETNWLVCHHIKRESEADKSTQRVQCQGV